jgi:hypothetical protein
MAMALIILAALVGDLVLRDGAGLQFLMRRLVTAIEWLAFWR